MLDFPPAQEDRGGLFNTVAAKVLFFGEDKRNCLPALERAGYSVDACGGLDEIHGALSGETDAAAVAVSGTWDAFLHSSILPFRARTGIPFVLFSESAGSAAGSVFDLVVGPGDPASQWLSELNLLIRECRATRADARRSMAIADSLRMQTQLTVQQSQLQSEQSRIHRESARLVRERSHLERKRSEQLRTKGMDDAALWQRQVPEATEQPIDLAPCAERDRLNWSILFALAQLTDVLFKMAKVKLDEDASGAMGQLRDEESSLAAHLEDLMTRWNAHRAAHGC